MGYSLLDKFRGAWLGSLIVQKIANNPQKLPFSPSNQEIISILQDRASRSNSPENENTGQLILAFLPTILYHHDDWSYLSAFLRQQANIRGLSSPKIDLILVWSYAIRLALRGEIINRDLTNRVVMGTGLKKKASVNWLEQVEMSCLNGCNSTQLIEQLSFLQENWEIPLSLFCFLNNSEDFYLTVQQALSLAELENQITVLSAILSGAYNGWTRIPVNWRNWLQNQDFYRPISQKINATIKDWSGRNSLSSTLTLPLIVSSPKILQPRSNFKIISQHEY
jgi:ADP-ribosylglycohydrolase